MSGQELKQLLQLAAVLKVLNCFLWHDAECHLALRIAFQPKGSKHHIPAAHLYFYTNRRNSRCYHGVPSERWQWAFYRDQWDSYIIPHCDLFLRFLCIGGAVINMWLWCFIKAAMAMRVPELWGAKHPCKHPRKSAQCDTGESSGRCVCFIVKTRGALQWICSHSWTHLVPLCANLPLKFSLIWLCNIEEFAMWRQHDLYTVNCYFFPRNYCNTIKWHTQ